MPASIDLDQQRKRAKDLRRAHREGAPAAAARVAAHLPRARDKPLPDILASPLTLSEAQLVVAREAGFESWPKMKHAVEAATPVDDERLLEAALAGRDAFVRRALASSRALPLHLAAALGDADGVVASLGHDVDQRLGRREWTPLLYACCARYGRGDPSIVAARVGIARRLLELGADVDAVGREVAYSTADIDGFDIEEWVALAGAAGRVASAELVRVLVAAKPDVERAPALLKQAVHSGELRVVEAALEAQPPWWQVIWALEACADLDRIDMARELVPHAPSAKSREPAVVRAIREQRGSELVALLLAPASRSGLDGADRSEAFPSRAPPFVDDSWRAVHEVAYRAARRYGHRAATELLRERGIDDAVLSAADRALAEPSATASARWTAPDHRLLGWSIAHGRLADVPRLLALGLDPSVHDEHGDLPLHHAVRARSIATIDHLLAAGAKLDAAGFDGTTPLALALAEHPEVAPHLLARGAREPAPPREDIDELFERAAEAITAGELEALRELLDDEPSLVHARSPRSHRAALIHYCGANGTERQATPSTAPAICALLLERGADPNAACNLYGGGATTLGLLLTSAHPRAAKLDGELVRVLAHGGARIDDGLIDISVQYASPLAIEALVEAGARVDLHVAAALDRRDLVDDMLARGVDVNTRFADGYTALHAAAGMGHAEMVKHLLARGADRTLRDTRFDGTPADKARYFDHPDVAALVG